MARSAGVSIENNFKAGLVTEVTGVNSPENSVVETLNVSYDRRGRASKRKGFQLETETPVTVQTRGAKTEFVWETVAENTGKTFVVVQLGKRVRFLSVEGDSSLIDGYESFLVNLADFKSPQFTDAEVEDEPCSFASGKGYLFIAHPMCDTIYVKYRSGNNTITSSRISIQIRDFEGVEDDLGITQRPNDLTNAHKYNLFNQGWYATALPGDEEDFVKNVLEYWQDKRDDNPSHADAWWYYLSAIKQDHFYPDLYADARKDLYGNTPVPKGHYIIDAFETNRRDLSGINSGVPESSSEGYRPSCVAFYAGRVFYAGVGQQDYSSSVFFSQIIQEDKDLKKCYQLNDPTSRETFDLLPSDGGVVKVQDINTVLDMKVIGPSLFIFASNGIWSITGSNDGPFKATDYFVTKVSSFPALSKTSVVDIGGLPVWWNYEGIYALTRNEIGTADVQSITEQSIQTFYDDIPQVSKEFAKGYFNDQDGLVYWVYNKGEVSDYKYNRILVFDTVTKAFYPYSIPTNRDQVFGLVAVRSTTPIITTENVVDNANEVVVDGLGDPVTILVETGKSVTKKSFKFLTQLDEASLNVATLTHPTYLDWGQDDYTSFFITGYRIRGDLIKQFQTNYLEVVSEQQTNSFCQVQGIWDYANSPDTGKFTNPQRCIREIPLRDYQRVRLRIRGQGRSLQFKFYGSAGLPFTIIGWSGFEMADQVP